MLKVYIITALLLWALCSAGQDTISAARFGALPGDTINDRDALQKAIDYCRGHRVKQLRIPPGVYRIRDEKAVQLMEDVMARKMGKNPQDVVYTPYYPYSRGLLLQGIENLEVLADGAVLMVEGWMEPLSVERCKKLRIQGITIDHKTPPHSEGMVISESAAFFDVRFSDGFPLKREMTMTRIMFWDLAKNRLFGRSVYFPPKYEIVEPGIVRIYAPHPAGITGSVALINHMMHFRPAILLLESAQTVLKNVTIHSQPGMGVVGHRSEDVLMTGLRIVPRPGTYQSTNTDATHFTACKGTIRFEGCTFEGQGDDATNVHSYYQQITKHLGGSRYTIQMEKAWGTHAMVLDFPDPGNEMELVARQTLQVAGRYKVVARDTFPGRWETHIQLNRPLPVAIDSFYLIDVARLPRLEFVNSYVGSHLARAVLVKTRNVLIENCTFRESTGTAIHIGAEGDWREGPGSANVTVRNNRILRCGRGDATNDSACAIAVNVKAPVTNVSGIHRRILIENNLIEGENAAVGVSVSGADHVTIRNNVFSGCREPLKIRHSTNVRTEHNYVGEQLMP